MIEQVLDLHIHSKYSRACSRDLTLPKIAKACEIKGVQIVSTADFTHPLWFEEIKEKLEETGDSGIFHLKDQSSVTRFIIGTEISCIYKDGEKIRRLHLLVFAANVKIAEEFIFELSRRGVNLKSDGRPIMGISAEEIVKICGDIGGLVVVPAHAWTPWYSVFGSKSGYDSLEECFKDQTANIFAIETGLSSDVEMNRRVSSLDKIALISNSDAHSLEKIGREANVLAFNNEREISFYEIWEIIKSNDKKRFLYTLEFYPEEGMYHYDGHRICKVSSSPENSKKANLLCKKCKKKMTIGVLHRVKDLSDRSTLNLNMFVTSNKIIPLKEIIASCYKCGVQTKRVSEEYNKLLNGIGSELNILLKVEKEVIKQVSNKNISDAILNMRQGNIKIVPGFDGVYGKLVLK